MKTSTRIYVARTAKLCFAAMLVTTLAGTGSSLAQDCRRGLINSSAHRAATRGPAVMLAQIVSQTPTAPGTGEAKDETPLHRHALHNDLAAARAIVREGAQLNGVNNEGMTPLMIAAKSGSLEVAKLLLRHGADTKIKDAQGRDALKLAKKNGHYEIALRIALAAAGH